MLKAIFFFWKYNFVERNIFLQSYSLSSRRCNKTTECGSFPPTGKKVEKCSGVSCKTGLLPADPAHPLLGWHGDLILHHNHNHLHLKQWHKQASEPSSVGRMPEQSLNNLHKWDGRLKFSFLGFVCDSRHLENSLDKLFSIYYITVFESLKSWSEKNSLSPNIWQFVTVIQKNIWFGDVAIAFQFLVLVWKWNRNRSYTWIFPLKQSSLKVCLWLPWVANYRNELLLSFIFQNLEAKVGVPYASPTLPLSIFICFSETGRKL